MRDGARVQATNVDTTYYSQETVGSATTSASYQAPLPSPPAPALNLSLPPSAGA